MKKLSDEQIENLLQQYRSIPTWNNFIKSIIEQLSLFPNKDNFIERIKHSAMTHILASEQDAETLSKYLWKELIENVKYN